MSNLAAERLRQKMHWIALPDLDAALAEERTHVIERIRERLESHPSLQWREIEPVLRILDDLSTPEQKR